MACLLLKSCIRNFRTFPSASIPSEATILWMVKRFLNRFFVTEAQLNVFSQKKHYSLFRYISTKIFSRCFSRNVLQRHPCTKPWNCLIWSHTNLKWCKNYARQTLLEGCNFVTGFVRQSNWSTVSYCLE